MDQDQLSDNDALTVSSVDQFLVPGSAVDSASDDGFGPAVPYGDLDLRKSRKAAAVYEAGLITSKSVAPTRKRGDPLHLEFCDRGSTAGYPNALASSWDRVSKKPHLQQLWESSPFLSTVLGAGSGWLTSFADRKFVQFGPVPPVPEKSQDVEEETEEVRRRRLALSDSLVFARAVRKFSSLSWPESNEIDRTKAFGRWRYIIDKAPAQFEIGRTILGDLATGADSVSEEVMLADFFTGKATRTLLTRAGPLILFLHWCKVSAVDPFPITEQKAYTYICHLRNVNSAATKAASFKSSLAFAMGVLGLSGVEEVLKSSRLSGAVMGQQLLKPILKQRRAFLVVEVLWFEHLCAGAPDVRDRVLAGFVLFMVFGRPRNGDCSLVSEILWDFVGDSDGFVEVSTTHAKTSRTVAQRTRFLPLTAPRLGLGKTPWADSWRKAREDAGLLDTNLGSGFALMPAPLLTGGWSDRPLSAGEVRKWSIELLRLRDPLTPTEVLGTRSGKVTGLSWMSKVGASDSIRRFLGYHIVPGDKSMATYSRDAAAEPLRQFNKMLLMIRLKQFDPDVSRSGYLAESVRTLGFENWSGERMPTFYTEADWESGRVPAQVRKTVDPDIPFEVVAPETPVHLVVPLDSDSEGTSSSDESEDADVSLAQTDIVEQEATAGVSSSSTVAEVLFFHDTLTTVHVQSPLNPEKLRCGRTLRMGYTKVQSLGFHWPRCKDCFNKCRP